MGWWHMAMGCWGMRYWVGWWMGSLGLATRWSYVSLWSGTICRCWSSKNRGCHLAGVPGLLCRASDPLLSHEHGAIWTSFHLDPKALFNMLGHTQQTLFIPRFEGTVANHVSLWCGTICRCWFYLQLIRFECICKYIILLLLKMGAICSCSCEGFSPGGLDPWPVWYGPRLGYLDGDSSSWSTVDLGSKAYPTAMSSFSLSRVRWTVRNLKTQQTNKQTNKQKRIPPRNFTPAKIKMSPEKGPF